MICVPFSKQKVRQTCNAWILELLYHEFATQESLLSCAKFMNDKIFKHKVRQACNAWILELLYQNLSRKFSFRRYRECIKLAKEDWCEDNRTEKVKLSLFRRR